MPRPRRNQRPDRNIEAVSTRHFRGRRRGEVHLQRRLPVRSGERQRLRVRAERVLEQQQKSFVRNWFVF